MAQQIPVRNTACEMERRRIASREQRAERMEERKKE